MEFLPAELIRKKRFGGEHTREEIHFFIDGYSRDKIPDYQIAAWLMAICFRGMSDTETAWLTQEMRDSGVVLDLSSLGTTVDKHSTGGIGDKTSLLLAPLVAAAGIPVPMMAGRGLGHTGGTLDKLEAIPGFCVTLTLERFRAQVQSLGCAIIGQTKEMCPADRKLYALRDVTGTIDSLPLICGSIMSKKLAEGMSVLVLDVKFGSGAFMKSIEDAERLALALASIGKLSGKIVRTLLTSMNEPLGRFVGNGLEIQECLDIFDGRAFAGDGKGYDDTIELTLALAGHMIFLGGKAGSYEEGRALATHLLRNGDARRKFNALVHAQGGDLSRPLPVATQRAELRASSSGFMQYCNAEKVGSASVILGAGRKFSADAIDPTAGIEVHRAHGDPIQAGDILFTQFASTQNHFASAEALLREAFVISPQPPATSPLIAKVLI